MESYPFSQWHFSPKLLNTLFNFKSKATARWDHSSEFSMLLFSLWTWHFTFTSPNKSSQACHVFSPVYDPAFLLSVSICSKCWFEKTSWKGEVTLVFVFCPQHPLPLVTATVTPILLASLQRRHIKALIKYCSRSAERGLPILTCRCPGQEVPSKRPQSAWPVEEVGGCEDLSGPSTVMAWLVELQVVVCKWNI